MSRIFYAASLIISIFVFFYLNTDHKAIPTGFQPFMTAAHQALDKEWENICLYSPTGLLERRFAAGQCQHCDYLEELGLVERFQEREHYHKYRLTEKGRNIAVFYDKSYIKGFCLGPARSKITGAARVKGGTTRDIQVTHILETRDPQPLLGNPVVKNLGAPYFPGGGNVSEELQRQLILSYPDKVLGVI